MVIGTAIFLFFFGMAFLGAVIFRRFYWSLGSMGID
jgi:hypothetical protein